MRITPKDIARALVDSVESQQGISADEACDSAMQFLHKKCPGSSRRQFLKLVEREVLSRGTTSAGMLVVPHGHSLKAEVITPHLEKKSGKTVHLERKVEPELIGGAVLLVDHRRIDCSIQGALQNLLRMCLQPLD